MLQQNMEIIPLQIFYSEKNIVKVELGIGKQKSSVDKREDLMKKEGNREIKRGNLTEAKGIQFVLFIVLFPNTHHYISFPIIVMKSSSRGGWD